MFHLLIKTQAKIEGFLREKSLALSKCFSESNGCLTAFFFDDEKRVNVFKELQHLRSSDFPNILLFPMWVSFSAGCVHFIEMTSKVFKKPFHEAFIGCRNVYTKVELSSPRWINFALPKHDTALSVNNSCEIGQFFPMIHGVHNV